MPPADPVAKALLLDIGHVVLELSWPAVQAYGRATGAKVPQPGDLPPRDDPRWRRGADGDPVGDGYWGEVARFAGLPGIIEMFRAVGGAAPAEMFVPDAVALIDDARNAGRPVGVLSNHAHMILGRDWFAARPELAGLTVFIDAAELGVPKPHPQGYLLAAEALGVAPGEVVFLDDTPDCVAGATAVGMTAILVERGDRAPAFAAARRLLQLDR